MTVTDIENSWRNEVSGSRKQFFDVVDESTPDSFIRPYMLTPYCLEILKETRNKISDFNFVFGLKHSEIIDPNGPSINKVFSPIIEYGSGPMDFFPLVPDTNATLTSIPSSNNLIGKAIRGFKSDRIDDSLRLREEVNGNRQWRDIVSRFNDVLDLELSIGLQGEAVNGIRTCLQHTRSLRFWFGRIDQVEKLRLNCEQFNGVKRSESDALKAKWLPILTAREPDMPDICENPRLPENGNLRFWPDFVTILQLTGDFIHLQPAGLYSTASNVFFNISCPCPPLCSLC
ncbi:MAG TPA: hypothetical protein DCE41_05440 [Cytophagales bacterium]|nr:hypothetical protein [Cytophagales bacterium]HAA24398.1 hypothetical protein [Cytophagales bacterium]